MTLQDQIRADFTANQRIDQPDHIAHHGVKGMRWGVRRSREALKTAPHSDAHSAYSSEHQAKTQGLHTLGNDELEALNKRLNLEQNYGKIQALRNPPKGVKVFIKNLLIDQGSRQLNGVINDVATRKRNDFIQARFDKEKGDGKHRKEGPLARK